EAWQRQEGCLTWFRAEEPGGERRRVQLRASIARDATGRSVGLIGSLDDVAAVTQSQDSATRAATILESSSDAVFSITDDSRVWFLNAAAEDLFGEGAEGGERTVQGLVSSAAFRRFEAEILPHLADEDSWTGELAMRGAGGRPIYLEVAFRAQRDTPRHLPA